MKRLFRSIVLVLAMTLFLNQPAQAFAQFIAPLVTKVIEKIMESSTSQQPSRSLPEPLTPEEASRGVPQGTLAGTMSPPKGRLVLMDGKVKRLAPGSRIYDSKNRIVLPGRVQGDIKVRYTTDHLGNVANIWLLSDPQYASTSARRSSNVQEDEPRVAFASSDDRR